MGGLLAVAGATYPLWSGSFHVTGPVFLWAIIGVIVIIAGANLRVEVDTDTLKLTAPPISWLPKIPLKAIDYVAEVPLTDLWPRFWSIHWLTFWPLGRALLVERRDASGWRRFFRPSPVLLVDDPQAFVELLAELGVPIGRAHARSALGTDDESL